MPKILRSREPIEVRKPKLIRHNDRFLKHPVSVQTKGSEEVVSIHPSLAKSSPFQVTNRLEPKTVDYEAGTLLDRHPKDLMHSPKQRRAVSKAPRTTTTLTDNENGQGSVGNHVRKQTYTNIQYNSGSAQRMSQLRNNGEVHLDQKRQHSPQITGLKLVRFQQMPSNEEVGTAHGGVPSKQRPADSSANLNVLQTPSQTVGNDLNNQYYYQQRNFPHVSVSSSSQPIRAVAINQHNPGYSYQPESAGSHSRLQGFTLPQCHVGNLNENIVRASPSAACIQSFTPNVNAKPGALDLSRKTRLQPVAKQNISNTGSTSRRKGYKPRRIERNAANRRPLPYEPVPRSTPSNGTLPAPIRLELGHVKVHGRQKMFAAKLPSETSEQAAAASPKQLCSASTWNNTGPQRCSTPTTIPTSNEPTVPAAGSVNSRLAVRRAMITGEPVVISTWQVGTSARSFTNVSHKTRTTPPVDEQRILAPATGARTLETPTVGVRRNYGRPFVTQTKILTYPNKFR